MFKASKRVYKRLSIGKLGMLLIFLFFAASLLFFGLSFKNSKIDFAKLAFEVNAQCKEDQSDRCFKIFFDSFSKDHPLNDSINLLNELQKINSKTVYCHSIAHAIAVAEVKKDPKNWLEVFDRVPEGECSYGYFHGVVEGKYAEDNTFTVNYDLINSICLRKSENHSRRGCAHAFGHLLLVQDSGEVSNSLQKCDKLDGEIQSPCYQGIFMENIQTENLSFHGIRSKKTWDDDFLNEETKFCEMFNGFKQAQCWVSLAPVILWVNHQDLSSSVQYCQTALDPSGKRLCIREVLGEVVLRRLGNDSSDINSDFCSLLLNQQEEYKNCVEDVLSYVLLTSKSYKKQMEGFCRNVKQEVRQVCTNRILYYD